MAETVQYYLEQMVPELQDHEEKGIFSKDEIRSIVKRRTKYEYSLKRRISKKIDFLRYIEYEMNLESLRLTRKKRLGLTKSSRSISDYAGARRIYFIFERALRKFSGDVSLWLQYIEFAKKERSTRKLGQIFARAIQLHPKNSSLWILAASYEWEHNANIVASRTLLQRALRMNSTTPNLWHEYFRLELVYIEKIKARRRVLGIDSTITSENNRTIQGLEGEDRMIDEVSADENMIMLPKITGEEIADNGDGAISSMESNLLEALKSGGNPVLDGLLAKIVFQNAIEAIPDSLDFRIGFIEIYRSFLESKFLEGEQEVYDSIARDFPQNPKAWAALAHQFLRTSQDNASFVRELKQAIDVYWKGTVEVEGDGVWKEFVSFLADINQKIQEKNLKLYVEKTLTKVFKSAQKKNVVSAELYLSLVNFLLESNELKQAQEISRQATTSFPKSEGLWRIRIEMAYKAGSEDEAPQALFSLALQHHPASLELWSIYIGWIENQWKGGVLTDDETENHFMDAIVKTSNLLPSSTQSQIKDLIMIAYVDWAASTHEGLRRARIVYKRLIKDYLVSPASFKAWIKLETKSGSQKYVDWLYEITIKADPTNADPYLSYITHLMSARLLQKASQIYWRGTRNVKDCEEFELQYRRLMDAGFDGRTIENGENPESEEMHMELQVGQTEESEDAEINL